jgi:FSR family fosmidomycin resistance protein-like MFS transporter
MAAALSVASVGGADRRGIVTLSIAHVINDMNQSVIPAIIPWLLVHRHLSLAAAASLVLATNLSSSVVQPLFGYLSDRRSLAWVIPVAIVVATFGTAVIGIAPTLPLMFAGALISGIGVAAFHPEGSRFSNYFSGAHRARGMGMFTTGGYLGFALGPLVITPLVVAFGLPGTALLMIPGVIIAVVLLADLPRFAAARAVAHRSHHHREGVDDWRAFSLLGLVVTLRSTAFFAAVTFTPVFAIAVAHVDKTLGSYALGALLIGGAAGTLWGGHLADRFDRRRVVSASLLLTAIFGGALAAAGTWMPVYALLVAIAIPFGLSLGLSAGVIVLMGQEYLPHRIGIASGVTLGLSVTIGGIGAPLFGALGDRFGLVSIFAALSVLALLSLLVSLRLPVPIGRSRA